jgi:diguanylate cyclase (GGDEF)-like protein
MSIILTVVYLYKNLFAMQINLTRSRTAIYLLLGFALFLGFYIAGWLLTNAHTSSHLQLMQRNQQAAIKMHVLASLIEIARERSRLAHEMVLVDDVFVKDELAQAVSSLAADFVVKRQQLLDMPLSATTQRIMQEQRSIYPVVITAFDQVAELALEDTPRANEMASSILLNQVVPNQHRIIDNFMRAMRNIELDVIKSSQDLKLQYQRDSQVRNLIGMVTLILSFIIIFVVTRNIISNERRLISFSTTDGLTGALNRRSFDHLLELEWKRSIRSDKPLSLILIDVDHFKAYNDLYGHHAGDRCLKQVANVVSGVLFRDEDIVARYGGEEFVVLLPNADEDGAWEVAQRMRLSVYGERIKHETSAADGFLTISLGVATMTASRDIMATDLFQAADQALYQAKAAGRNQVRIYDPLPGLVSAEQGIVA